MPPLDPRTDLGTHQVMNQPPARGDVDLWAEDAVLRDTVVRHRQARRGTRGRWLPLVVPSAWPRRASWPGRRTGSRRKCAPLTPLAGASTRWRSTPAGTP